jgi:transposase
MEEKLTYQQATGISKIPIKMLTSFVHRKRKVGHLNEKNGRPKLLDPTSEENIMSECRRATIEPEQVSTNEFKKHIKACIRNECLETHNRRYNYNQTPNKKFTKASSKTVSRYLNEFSQKYLKTF